MDEQELTARVIEAVDANQSVIAEADDIPDLRTLVDQWFQEHPDVPLPQEVRWEVWMLDLVGKYRTARQENLDERFTSRAVFSDGSTYPDVEQLTASEEAFQYFRQRAAATANPVRKARYADFVWSFRNLQRGANLYPFVQIAANAYLAQTGSCLAQDHADTLICNLDRVAELAVEVNNAELARNTVVQVKEVLGTLLERDEFRAVSYLGGTLVYLSRRFPRIVSVETWQDLLTTCDEVIAVCTADESRNILLAEEFGDLASAICTRLGEPGRAWQYQVQNVERIEQEAYRIENQDEQPAGLLSAFQQMKAVIHAYQQLLSLAPDAEQQQLIKQKMNPLLPYLRRLIREIQPQLVAFPSDVAIPEELQEIVDAVVQAAPNEFIGALLNLVLELVPRVEKVKEVARQMEEDAPLLTRLARITLRDGRQVNEIAPIDEETPHFVHAYHDCLTRYAIVIDYVIQRLIEARRISLDMLTKHITEWVYIDADDVPFIERGLERYFAPDYISTISVLVPRFEHMLKTAFETLNIVPLVIPNERQIREQTLGDFLRRQEVREPLGEDVWHFLSHTLVDKNSLNLRNDLSHGWLQLHNTTRIMANLVLYILLLFTAWDRSAPAA